MVVYFPSISPFVPQCALNDNDIIHSLPPGTVNEKWDLNNNISSPWIWKGVSATLQSGRYTLSYPTRRYIEYPLHWIYSPRDKNIIFIRIHNGSVYDEAFLLCDYKNVYPEHCSLYLTVRVISFIYISISGVSFIHILLYYICLNQLTSSLHVLYHLLIYC